MHHDQRPVLVDDNARQPGQVTALLQALRQAHPDRHLVVAVAPWGTKNRRDLAAWALGLAEAETAWVLPVGDAAVPGGETPDADARLAELIRLEGTPAYTITLGGPLPLLDERTAEPRADRHRRIRLSNSRRVRDPAGQGSTRRW